VPDRGRGRPRGEAGVVSAVPVQPRVPARRHHRRRLQQRDRPSRRDEGGITHAEVAAEIAVVKTDDRRHAAPGARCEAEGRAFVESERAIAAAAFSGDVHATWAAQADAAAFEQERAHANAAFEAILGTPFQLPSATTLANACWLTPSMRFNELYGPRQYAPRSSMSPVLARMWLAWLGFAALGEDLAGRPFGLQELTTLWSEQAPLMHAVARWSESPSLKPGPMELPGVDPGGLVKKLGMSFVENRKAKQPFGALVIALGSDPTTRVTALKSADALLRAGFAR
jgi:hypothetical protein